MSGNAAGRVSGVRRGVVGFALFCSAITSPFLERATTELAVTTGPATTPQQGATVAPSTFPAATTTASTNPPPATTTARALTTAGVGSGSIDTIEPPESTVAEDPQWKAKVSPEYIVRDVGCAKDLSAAGLAAFFAQPIGPIKGFDGPRSYPLGDGRTLWALQDTFIDFLGTTKSFAHMWYANSTVLIQDGNCFTSLQRGTPNMAISFEIGDGNVNFDHYYWPAGATVHDGVLEMFWMEMQRDPKLKSGFDGIALHPVATWLATYDVATMHRLSFAKASNPTVLPVYGYTVVDDGDWDYLFGNSYLQNLSLEGGYDKGPHTATKMYLARVPRGHLEDPPVYWNGTAWSDDSTQSVPISSRNWTENSMLPVKLDGRWVSATKTDGFLGHTVTIDVADHPWGPWTTVKTLPATPRGDPTDVVTYHALVLPYLDPSGALIVCLSQIPLTLGTNDAPAKYRPNVFTVSLT